MAVIVGNIRLPLGAGDEAAIEKALKRLGLPRREAEEVYIARSSPDLRHMAHPVMVYAVGVELSSPEREEKLTQMTKDPDVRLRRPVIFDPQPGTEPLRGRPVIAGFGPAGMFAGLLLARRGYRPLILERGADVDTRVRAVERFWADGRLDAGTNVQFGEGGAGTFSDGKLTTRINDPLCETVLGEFVRHGAPEQVRRLAKPHIGTDRLRGIVRAFREDILACGGEVRFCAPLTALDIRDGRLRAVTSGEEETETGALVLAVGHSARDTFSMLRRSGAVLLPKPFSAGVRIEHRQSAIERALYGRLAGSPHLPRGEYQLSMRRGESAVYTFCMCPGGMVVAAASEAGGVVTNGMSRFARDGENANSALAVSVGGFADPMEGIEFQRRLERAAFAAGAGGYRAPVQTVGAFLEGTDVFRPGTVKPTYPCGVTPARLDRLLPAEIACMLADGLRAFDRQLHGFAAPGALLTGVETRTSSPVRMARGAGYEAEGIAGLYPAGEGAGYAGGIMSAAVDGLRVAGAIVERYAPPV